MTRTHPPGECPAPHRPAMRLSRRRCLVQAGLALTCAAVGMASARRALSAQALRTALVIGNASYAVAPLHNPLNDARLVAGALQQLDFRVTRIEDGNLKAMIEGIRDWLADSKDAQSRFFFFAGHGAQWQGRNFLLPVDAELQSEEELAMKAVSATDLTERLARIPTGVNVVVLDACRNMPYPLTTATAGRSRAATGSVAPGLVAALPPQGTLIAFATSPGAIALDGKPGSSSTYTRHLVAQMSVPGVPVETMFKRVRAAVARETGNRQVPWETSSLVGDYCLQPGTAGQCNAASAPAEGLDVSRVRQ